MDHVRIAFHTLQEASQRAIQATGNYVVSLSGDYGQDEDQGETGLGNDDYSIVVWPNGTAVLTLRRSDNDAYLEN